MNWKTSQRSEISDLYYGDKWVTGATTSAPGLSPTALQRSKWVSQITLAPCPPGWWPIVQRRHGGSEKRGKTIFPLRAGAGAVVLSLVPPGSAGEQPSTALSSHPTSRNKGVWKCPAAFQDHLYPHIGARNFLSRALGHASASNIYQTFPQHLYFWLNNNWKQLNSQAHPPREKWRWCKGRWSLGCVSRHIPGQQGRPLLGEVIASTWLQQPHGTDSVGSLSILCPTPGNPSSQQHGETAPEPSKLGSPTPPAQSQNPVALIF